MRVWLLPVRFDMESICSKTRAAGAEPIMNSYAQPALRSGVASAACTACDRFNRRVSPAVNGRAGVSVIVWFAFENAIVPAFGPVDRPNTRKRDAVIDDDR